MIETIENTVVTIVTNAEEDGLNKELNKTNNDSKT